MRKRSRTQWLIHLAILVLVGLAAWQYIDFRELGQAMLRADPVLLVLLLGVSTLDRSLMAWKWLHLMRAIGVEVPFRPILSAYYQASFVGRLMPISSLGADVMRGYLVARHTPKRAEIAGSIVVEKIVAILGAVSIATLGACLLARDLAREGVLYLLPVVPAVGALVLLLFTLSLSKRASAGLVKLVPGKRLKRLFRKLHDAYSLYEGRRRKLAINLGLTVVEQSLQLTILYLCARTVGVETGAVRLLAVLALAEFLRKLAIVLEGWGLAEFMVVITLSVAGIDSNLALALSLLAHAVGWVATFPGGWLLLVRVGGRDVPGEGVAE